MEKISDGIQLDEIPLFQSLADKDGRVVICQVVSLRDLFSGQALAGLLAKYGIEGTPDGNASAAVENADALIKELAARGDARE